MLKANCRDLPIASGPESSLPGMYWQWNPAVRTKSLSIIGLICQWEASYQPLSFIQWPWWQLVWETKTTKWGSRKEVWEQTLSSVFFRIFYTLSKWSSGSGGSVPPPPGPLGGPVSLDSLDFSPFREWESALSACSVVWGDPVIRNTCLLINHVFIWITAVMFM